MRRAFLLALPALAAACASVEDEPTRVVFFTADSAALDGPAREVVTGAARRAARFPNSRVRILGYTGPAGEPEANRILARERAEAVAAALREAGVAPGRISVAGRGAVGYELVPVESRRVEIHFEG
ncbi:OmpA family protein [Sabulicella glaciei]|uniref:OmpA family protein n=1 Tax=Sabulicella glaciei TaxID=2984948 RepID=A0ABT3NTD0_9PROT|nr:OmpA family protein [Roseococcus sp. MDT2-1-1]MCW8085421.1 OmpA family protein [Roseococcus sp. MDT2-1-1]